jgi:hypothetical protein
MLESIPTIPELGVGPVILFAVGDGIWETQILLAKVNPFSHLRHWKSEVNVTQLEGILLANPNNLSKYITPVLPTSKVGMVELKELPA